MTQRPRHRTQADEADELVSRRKPRGRPWWHFAIPGGVVAVGAVIGLCCLLGSGERPTIEVAVPSADIKAGNQLLTRAALGDRFTVLGLDGKGDWYKVRVPVKEGEEQEGWIRVSDVRLIEAGRGKGADAAQVQITAVDYPDRLGRESKPYGQRWLFVDVTVRPREAESDGAYPIQTNRFVISNPLVVSKGRAVPFTNPRYCKVTTVGKEQKEVLAPKGEAAIVRVPKDVATPMSLVFTVPTEVLIRDGWSIRYVPPPPSAIPQATAVPEPAPKGGTSIPAATAPGPAPKGGTDLPAAK